MFDFRKGLHGLLGRKVSTIDFATAQERDAAFRLLEMLESLVEEADNEGYAVEPLGGEGMRGLTVVVLDSPHAKASASGVAAMRGAAGTSSEKSSLIPLDQTWDRNDLRAVAAQMRGLKEKFQGKEDD